MTRRPQWLWQEGLVYQGLWEPIYFLKSSGKAGTNVDAIDEFRHSEAFVEALHRRGVNQVWTHFWKGYGWDREREQMERNRDLVAWCRARGMRVIAYFTLGSLTPETLLVEKPEAADGLQVGEGGGWASYGTGHQCFRARPCYNAQGWLDYLKEMLTFALADIGCDGVHFDNVHNNAEPDTCHCDKCVSAFREFLSARYGPQTAATRAAGMARFGRNDFSQTARPWFNRFNQAVLQRVIEIALQQEWVMFKTESMRRAIGQMADHIRSVKGDALVEANLGGGIGSNTEYHRGTCAEVSYPQVDLAFDESARRVGVGPNGQTHTRIREHKRARAAGIPAILYSTNELALAETFAFNPGSFAGGGTAEVNAWYHRHKRYQLDARTLSEVAVLRHRETLAYNAVRPYLSAITIEQVLIERRIPWDMVWKGHLGDLGGRRLLILPDVECLSDEEAGQIAAFVRGGGAVLATEDAGRYDNWRRLRQRPMAGPIETPEQYAAVQEPSGALAELFGPDPAGGGEPIRRELPGGGRACYLPKIDYTVWPPSGTEFWAVFPEHWAMPGNAAEILSAVDWCLGGQRRLVVESAQRVVVEHTAVGDEEVVHLLHCDESEGPASAVVRLRREPPAEVLAMGLGENLKPVDFRAEGGVVTVELKGFRTYRMLLFRG